MRRYEFFSVALKILIFALMIFVYIQTLTAGKKSEIPYRLVLQNDEDPHNFITFNIRPEISIPKKTYDLERVDRLKVLASPPFCDSADELIEVFQNNQLVFVEAKHFLLLKSQFKTIGYNFNTHPKYLFHKTEKSQNNPISEYLKNNENLWYQSEVYAQRFIELMHCYVDNTLIIQDSLPNPSAYHKDVNIGDFKMAPGVYFFLDEFKEVIYVGKARQIKKRLQSHFSQPSKENAIDYSRVNSIQVEYSGNDMIAQLIESANIKDLKPIYNTQQVKDPAPYIINKGKTAKGIHKLQITRKDIKDNMPERYFNRVSVKQALENFCNEFNLCRKHCGIEKVKGPCSKVTVKRQQCVCADKTLITDYNERFESAFKQFKNRNSSKIYKLKGRHSQEDAFIYMVNGIYEGYGFIDNNEIVSTTNDVLGHLIKQRNNYDTSRIVSRLDALVPKDHILILTDF